MPWVVGIDEAGYGPNLGPLVQAAVGLRLPDEDLAGWETLKPWVRRCHEKDDGRLLIDDSKKVYAGVKGFERLEHGAMCALCVFPNELGSNLSRPAVMGDLLRFSFPDLCDMLRQEFWFVEGHPIANNDPQYAHHFTRNYLGLVAECGGIAHIRPLIIPTVHFNGRLDDTGSKSTLLSDGLIRLLTNVVEAGTVGIDYSTEPMLVLCDKLGGRNFYAPILQDAFPDGWIVSERESAAESRYRVVGLNREVTVVFRPKADGDSVCVALASMVCKYLREVCMRQFNAFWQRHVPGLEPTAGYPFDAKRFYDAIRPTMAKLGIHPDAVWRKK
jgi:hypothetical protein